jgi:hypothetical protein
MISGPPSPLFESVESDLFGYLYPPRPSGWMAGLLHTLMRRDTDGAVRAALVRLDFDRHQVDYLMHLRSQNQGLDIDAFVELLFERRVEFAAAFPGFVSRHDRVGWAQACELGALNDLLRDRRVALVGPSQHIVGSRSASRIESYDVVVRLNNQWPVPPKLRADLGTRMDVLFHCCNNDTSIEWIFREAIRDTRLICYELGISAFRLIELAASHRVPVQCVSLAYRDLADRLGTHPNTGTVATALLLQSPLSELFITGMTYFRDPYYAGYRGAGNRRRSWRFRRRPVAIGPHNLAVQFPFIMNLLRGDSRVTLDARLAQIVAQFAADEARSRAETTAVKGSDRWGGVFPSSGRS